MATRTRKAPVPTEASVQVTEAVKVDAVTVQSKPTATERLVQVLMALNKTTVKDITTLEVGYGKAVGLLGGGSVYINRGNADVRSSQKQVAEWVKAGLGTARGPQSQYLRITF